MKIFQPPTTNLLLALGSPLRSGKNSFRDDRTLNWNGTQLAIESLVAFPLNSVALSIILDRRRCIQQVVCRYIPTHWFILNLSPLTTLIGVFVFGTGLTEVVEEGAGYCQVGSIYFTGTTRQDSISFWHDGWIVEHSICINLFLLYRNNVLWTGFDRPEESPLPVNVLAVRMARRTSMSGQLVSLSFIYRERANGYCDHVW